MKRLLFAAILLLSLSMIFPSCSSNVQKTIEGYWVSGDVYLFCDGEKIYKGYGDGSALPEYNFDQANNLFQSRDTSDYYYKFGYLIVADLLTDKPIDVIAINDDDTKSDEELISTLNSAGPSSQTYVYLAARADELDHYEGLFYDKENNILKEFCYQAEGGEFKWARSFEKIEPATVSGEAKDKKEKKGQSTKSKDIKNVWSSMFDENRIAAFDTGLTMNSWTNRNNPVYLFLNAYSYSDDYSEGTACVSCIYLDTRGKKDIELKMNCEYKYKEGVVYLKRGLFVRNNNWLPLRVHEMPLTFNSSDRKLSGKLWVDNLHDYYIDASSVSVGYTSVGVWRNGIF